MKKSFKIMMLIAVNLALLILLSDFCALNSYAVNLGENGERIAVLQRSLKKEGYYGGKINGLYDFTTKKAVRTFKKKNKINDDDDYRTFSALGLYLNDCCYGADVELLAKHLKSNGIIEYHDMVTECESVLRKSGKSSLYAYIIGTADDISRLIDEKPNSEQYTAAYDALKRYEINPTPF